MSGEHVLLEILDSVPQKRISETRRFAILVLGSLCCMCCSFSYAFNLIAPTMQQKYNLSQRDITTITTVGLVVQYSSLPYAFLYDHFGPLIVSALGLIYFVTGSVGMALCFQGIITGTVVRLSVLNAIMLSGCSMFDLTSCVTTPSHFPTRKGLVAALLKTFTGLGSAIVGALYIAFFNTRVDNYLFFLAAIGGVTGICAIAFMHLPSYHLTNYQLLHMEEDEKRVRLARKTQYLKQNPPLACFIYGFALITFLIVFLPTESALVTYLNLSSKYKAGFGIIVTIATLAFIGVAFPVAFIKELNYKRKSSSSFSSEPLSVNNNREAPYNSNNRVDNDTKACVTVSPE
uniref:Oxalate:formate antiporter n=2 Tax=Lygus hesperus TaxID=30085 RepID=A0A0A9WUS9_LYGHE